MSRDIFLTGASEPDPPIRKFSAGRLSATLQNGGLRWVRWDGVEVLRAILFLVRTPGWGTADPEISDLHSEETNERFAIRHTARYRDGDGRVTAKISLKGSHDGRLEAVADISAESPFPTNRTGFVVLHPLEGVAGAGVVVEHASGASESVTIPAEISPGQPVFDIRALTHRPLEGLSVRTAFTGDIFEMEDHRNWSDASFKSYSRPIGWPYPYTLQPGEDLRQAVDVAIVDERAAGVARRPDRCDDGALVSVGRATSVRLPALAIGLSAPEAEAASRYADRLRGVGADHALLRIDAEHPDAAEAIAAAAELSVRANLPIAAEILLHAEDDPAPEIARIESAFRQAGLSPHSIAAFPKADERSFQPGEPRPPAPAETVIAGALRARFPGVPIGGGTPAFFTEFNRKRPPSDLFDFLIHATTPTVHAADDLSVMETLQALPHIVRSVRAIGGAIPYRIGPIGIGARLNPYGAGPTPNPEQRRVGLADADPRQRGLFAAAWHLGYAATVAPFALQALVLGAPIGPFGLVSTRQPYARPWWDEQAEGVVYPLFHVAADLAEAGLHAVVDARANDPRLSGLAWESDGRRTLLVANLSAAPIDVSLSGLSDPLVRILDAETLPQAARDPDRFRADLRPLGDSRSIALDAYATARFQEGARR